MTSSRRILKIEDNKFYYTKYDFIPLEKTNLPAGKLTFRYNQEIYWEVELKEYDKDSQTIEIDVLNYATTDITNFNKQIAKKVIRHLHFLRLDWYKLEPLLSSYQELALRDVVERIQKNQIDTNKKDIGNFFNKGQYNNGVENQINEYNENESYLVDIDFSFYYKDASFENGYVSIFRKFDFSKFGLKLKIFNDNILSEYDYIKNYFPKYFKQGKKFNVTLKGEVQNGQLQQYKASSIQIESIKNEVIEIVRGYRNLEILDAESLPEDNTSIFSINEVIQKTKISEDLKNDFEKDEKEIINSILLIKKIRNKKQLEYLSGYKQSGEHKIRFTLKPLFGFIFLIEGNRKKHFCWELLNSHATYIWSFDSKFSFTERIDSIDSIINKVRTIGRKMYKQEMSTKSFDADYIFRSINHKVNTQEYKDGFINWKSRLEENLI